MSKQPEAKFKKALVEGFDAAFGSKAKDAVCAYMKGSKDGFPDLFFSFLGISLWIEAKVGGNDLEKSQVHFLPRLAAAGSVVWVASANSVDKRVNRVITMSRVGTPSAYLSVQGWKATLSTVEFWKLLKEQSC